MTKRQRTKLGKQIAKEMSGIKLLISAHDSFRFSTQQIYSDAIVEIFGRELRISGTYMLRWFRIEIEAITDIKVSQVKRYTITLDNGMTVTLSEFFD